MEKMKTKILAAAAALVGLATTIGIINALFSHGSDTAARLGLVSVVLGLGSMGLFFVGLAFPKDL